MDGEIIYGCIILAGLVWWMWRANNPKQPEIRPEPAGITFTKGPDSRPANPGSDPFLDAIEAERLNMEQKAKEEQEVYAKAIEAKVLDDEKLKSRLTKFAQENKLDTALVEVWEEMRSYPAWYDMPSWPELNRMGVENPREEPGKKFSEMILHFTYLGSEYRIAPRELDSSEDDTSYIDLQLLENGEEVFAITCKVFFDYMTLYRPIDVKAFKKRGNWASMLVQLLAKKKLLSEKSRADWRATAARDIKKRFAE
jgi:hypothetical protein